MLGTETVLLEKMGPKFGSLPTQNLMKVVILGTRVYGSYLGKERMKKRFGFHEIPLHSSKTNKGLFFLTRLEVFCSS